MPWHKKRWSRRCFKISGACLALSMLMVAVVSIAGSSAAAATDAMLDVGWLVLVWLAGMSATAGMTLHVLAS